MDEIEQTGVRPDGYKATDEEVAQQEEMIKRKGLSCDVVVAENATTSPTCKESLQVGNMAKLREALEQIYTMSNRWYFGVDTSKSSEDLLVECGELAESALAEPLRNCDVGTPREQAERFNDFCNSHYSLNNPEGVCSECPLTRDGSTCEFEWLQLPYKKEGEE